MNILTIGNWCMNTLCSVGHEGVEMPHFQFSPPMIAALMAYMDAVQAI
jgi:hypothetical protein